MTNSTVVHVLGVAILLGSTAGALGQNATGSTGSSAPAEKNRRAGDMTDDTGAARAIPAAPESGFVGRSMGGMMGGTSGGVLRREEPEAKAASTPSATAPAPAASPRAQPAAAAKPKSEASAGDERK